MTFILPNLSTLPQWNSFARIGLDIETRDPDLKKTGPGVRRGQGYITGISFACDDGTPNGPAYYLPIRHQGGGNYPDAQAVLAYFQYQAKHFRGEIVGANLQYDLDWLEESGIKFQPAFFRDIQVSGPLLEVPRLEKKIDKTTGEMFYGEARNLMSLDAQAKRCGLAGKDETELNAWAKANGLKPKSDMWKAHASIVSQYAIADARLPLEILAKHEREIDAQDLWPVYDMESRLLPALLQMRRIGVRIDFDRLAEIDSAAAIKEVEAAKVISARSGIRFDVADINKAAVLAKHLEADGVRCPLTAKTKKPSIKADWLGTLETPVAQAIKVCRKWNKIRGTFVQSIRAHAVGDRIHCSLNQLKQESDQGDVKGAQYGRLSSSNPNLQQQPSRDREIQPAWRTIYLPDEGGTWTCIDVKSQEPRILTHYAELVGCAGGAAAAHACRTEADWDNHSMMASLTYGNAYSAQAYRDGDKAAKEMRSNSKTTYLGRCYGMGDAKLCHSLGFPTVWKVTDWSDGKKVERPGVQGEAFIAKFNNGVPYIKQLQKMVQTKAESVGYITTLMGRRCRFPTHPITGKYEQGYKALNRLIQGSAGDQTKMAMVLAHEAGVRMQLQVHDEIDLTTWNPDEVKQLEEIMIHALELNVPTLCDVEQGPSWGEIK